MWSLSVWAISASDTTAGVGLRPSVTPMAIEGSAGLGFGLNKLGCAKSIGASSWRATITRTPSLVTRQSFWAKSCDMRMQPCEAG